MLHVLFARKENPLVGLSTFSQPFHTFTYWLINHTFFLFSLLLFLLSPTFMQWRIDVFDNTNFYTHFYLIAYYLEHRLFLNIKYKMLYGHDFFHVSSSFFRQAFYVWIFIHLCVSIQLSFLLQKKVLKFSEDFSPHCMFYSSKKHCTPFFLYWKYHTVLCGMPTHCQMQKYMLYKSPTSSQVFSFVQVSTTPTMILNIINFYTF